MEQIRQYFFTSKKSPDPINEISTDNLPVIGFRHIPTDLYPSIISYLSDDEQMKVALVNLILSQCARKNLGPIRIKRKIDHCNRLISSSRINIREEENLLHNSYRQSHLKNTHSSSPSIVTVGMLGNVTGYLLRHLILDRYEKHNSRKKIQELNKKIDHLHEEVNCYKANIRDNVKAESVDALIYQKYV